MVVRKVLESQYSVARDSYDEGVAVFLETERVQEVGDSMAAVDCTHPVDVTTFPGSSWLARRSRDWVVKNLAASTQVLPP